MGGRRDHVGQDGLCVNVQRNDRQVCTWSCRYMGDPSGALDAVHEAGRGELKMDLSHWTYRHLNID